MTRLAPTHAVIYEADLAQIHVDGYGFHWEGAAEPILKWFQESAITKGDAVVDLGCGGGQWLERLGQAGYRAHGIDVSKNMIRIAKENAPGAAFLRGSFAEVAIPKCTAATSLGEPLNYLSGGPEIRRSLRNVFAALAPGGLFVFDVRHPAKGPVEVKHHHKVADNWFCYARIEEDAAKNQLTRFITTFRRLNDGNYRRDQEIHRLKVYPRAEMVGWLRDIGFRVKTKRGYGEYRLGPRQSVFICRKPAS